MPGPGGGPYGGGGHRGGGGGYHSGHRPSRMHRRGCLGSFISMILLPIILIFCVFNILFSIFGSSVSQLASGGIVKYDENKFQDYADSQYAVEFGSSTSYEDNILLVFLVDEEKYYDYYYIAWVGDHINTSINYMFGNESTELGRAVSSSINMSSYKYSLDTNLAQVVETMKNHIVSRGLESSFTCEENHVQVMPHLSNNSSIDLTDETVNAAIVSFTEETGIPLVVVVEDITSIFPKQMTSGAIFALVISITFIVLAVYLVVKNIRKRKDFNNGKDYYDAYFTEKK